MKNDKIAVNIKKISTIAGVIGTIGGIISDVLTPLAPFALILSGILISIGVIFFIFKKKEKLKLATLDNSIIALITGVIFLGLSLVADDDKGLLASNVPAIERLQGSLNIVNEKLDVVDEKIDDVSDQVGTGFESMEANFDNLEKLIEANNPIDNPSSPLDFIVNAYLFMESGDEKKSLRSFEEFLNLSEVEKIDVYKDYYSVCISVKGKSEASNRLKSYNSKLADLVIIDAEEETFKGYLSRVKELELNKELLCIAYRMNLNSSRRSSNFSEMQSMFKSCLLAYSTCSKYGIEEDYSDFEYLFLKSNNISDIWTAANSKAPNAEDYLRTSILEQLMSDAVESPFKGGLLQQYLTGETPKWLVSDDAEITGFEKNESEEFNELLELWIQFCADQNVEWTYN